MSALVNLDRKVLRKMQNGPVWARSLQMVRPVLDRLIREGYVLRCCPKDGRAHNMVRLSVRGEIYLGLSAPAATTIDQFAEHLANGASVRAAAEAVGSSLDYGHRMLQRIRKRLGWQAI